jgi:hypothetical protein
LSSHAVAVGRRRNSLLTPPATVALPLQRMQMAGLSTSLVLFLLGMISGDRWKPGLPSLPLAAQTESLSTSAERSIAKPGNEARFEVRTRLNAECT